VVKVEDIDRSKSFECETVKGSKVKHQVWSLSPKDPTLCQYHQLSCFCGSCIGTDPETHCVNKDYVLERILMHLRPKNFYEVWEIMYDSNEDIEASNGG
jgi:hypothetical protein